MSLRHTPCQRHFHKTLPGILHFTPFIVQKKSVIDTLPVSTTLLGNVAVPWRVGASKGGFCEGLLRAQCSKSPQSNGSLKAVRADGFLRAVCFLVFREGRHIPGPSRNISQHHWRGSPNVHKAFVWFVVPIRSSAQATFSDGSQQCFGIGMFSFPKRRPLSHFF